MTHMYDPQQSVSVGHAIYMWVKHVGHAVYMWVRVGGPPHLHRTDGCNSLAID